MNETQNEPLTTTNSFQDLTEFLNENKPERCRSCKYVLKCIYKSLFVKDFCKIFIPILITLVIIGSIIYIVTIL